jgi:hypothetical protein
MVIKKTHGNAARPKVLYTVIYYFLNDNITHSYVAVKGSISDHFGSRLDRIGNIMELNWIESDKDRIMIARVGSISVRSGRETVQLASLLISMHLDFHPIEEWVTKNETLSERYESHLLRYFYRMLSGGTI